VRLAWDGEVPFIRWGNGSADRKHQSDTQSGLPDLLYLLKHPECCATDLIANTFLKCHAALFNDRLRCYPLFCGIYLS
jgi:hypothetical protein